MYLLDREKLQIGDIFLTTQKHPVSKAIRVFSMSNFSHAILYVGDGSYIHSDGDGVHSGNVQRLLFNAHSHVQVLRMRNDIDRELVSAACAFARREVGKQYSVKDAISTKNPLSNKNDSNRQFCSRLVAQSYESIGLKIVKNSSFCTPQELDSSEFTIRIGDCLKEASNAEEEFANSESPLEKQAHITNLIFGKIRGLTGEDIQTFEQLMNYLLVDPKYDKQITNIIQDSGYLLLWQHEIDANPWRYNQEAFMDIPVTKRELRDLAFKELDSAKNTRARYVLMYEQFMHVFQAKRLQYALINIMLYRTLIELTDKRISISSHVLEDT